MKNNWIYIILITSLMGCIETFEVPMEVDEAKLSSTLIVEATITNELKRQEVFLSRPSDFGIVNEEDSIFDPNLAQRPIPPSIIFEEGAEVMITDDNGNTFRFNESSPGKYISEIAFAAQREVNYELGIITSDGISYFSEPENYKSVSEIDEVYAVKDFNETGNEGVYIYVDGQGLGQNDNYYRYTYEETYKIIAPEWREEDFLLTNYDPCALPVPTYDLQIVNRENEFGRVCYGRDTSSDIIQTSTLGFQENSIQRFPVRFLNRNNYIISHRYSILVKQYVQSISAYNFYNTLESFSSSENVFSTVQPGVLTGNIKSQEDDSKTVLGFFEVAPVVEKRLFFNYEDFFQDEPLPDYPVGCFPRSSPESHISYCFTGLNSNNCPTSIIELVNINLISYFGENEDGPNAVGICPGPYVYTPRACGDCTVLGASEVPSFWIE